MPMPHETTLWTLLAGVAGTRRSERLFRTLEVHSALLTMETGRTSRAEAVQALNMLLFEDVVKRVPEAQAYVNDAVRQGRKLTFDHGALRTVAAPCGTLPSGRTAFTRILEPLGFRVADLYPLDRLGMTGRAYTHSDLPEAIAQFFVSEFHPERFDGEFQAAVERVVSSSKDPLSDWAKHWLNVLAVDRSLPTSVAVRLLPDLLACFDRQHDEPSLADYDLLLSRSEEMAWIATEGNTFNHAADRVADVTSVADEQRKLGRAVKKSVEVSASQRVMQTAFQAPLVPRLFVTSNGDLSVRAVPGSFHEFIARREKTPGTLDLGFDAANAQAIFKMTAGSKYNVQ